MTAKLIKITANKKQLALIIKSGFQTKENQFLTSKNNPLQLGILKFPKNYLVKPHSHRQFSKTTHKNQEFIYIVSGKIKATFYHQKKKIQTTILNSGDILLQISGGHSFKMLKLSKLITIKQGPYKGTKKEKSFI